MYLRRINFYWPLRKNRCSVKPEDSVHMYWPYVILLYEIIVFNTFCDEITMTWFLSWKHKSFRKLRLRSSRTLSFYHFKTLSYYNTNVLYNVFSAYHVLLSITCLPVNFLLSFFSVGFKPILKSNFYEKSTTFRSNDFKLLPLLLLHNVTEDGDYFIKYW